MSALYYPTIYYLETHQSICHYMAQATSSFLLVAKCLLGSAAECYQLLMSSLVAKVIQPCSRSHSITIGSE